MRPLSFLRLEIKKLWALLVNNYWLYRDKKRQKTIKPVIDDRKCRTHFWGSVGKGKGKEKEKEKKRHNLQEKVRDVDISQDYS